MVDNDGDVVVREADSDPVGLHAAPGAMAEADPSLQDQQPWKAAFEKDMKWLGAAMVKHYHWAH